MVAWRALTSARGAFLVIILLTASSLAGIALPQLPPGAALNGSFKTAWLEEQGATFGNFAPLMRAAGLFDIFHSWWFFGLLGWMVASISACTINRCRALFRDSFRPPHRVADARFDHDPATRLAPGTTPGRAATALGRRWYRVWREQDRDVTYLFADRFPWAAFGTFATHLGLVLILLGAAVSKFDGFSTSLAIAEGRSAPVFPLGDRRHLIIGVERAVGVFDSEGRPRDYRTDLSLVRNGALRKTCTVTVNDPCSLDGYRFHQAGFFGFGVDLAVRDAHSGSLLYRETLALSGSLEAPRVVVKDGQGAVVYRGTVPQVSVVGQAAGALVEIAQTGQLFWIELERSSGESRVVVFDASPGGDGASGHLLRGATIEVGGLIFELDAVEWVPAVAASGVPLPSAASAGIDGSEVLLALENPRFGIRTDDAAQEPAALYISGLAPVAVRLEQGQPVHIGPYEYEFLGQRNFAGIGVRKDRGAPLIWLAGGLFVLGLVLTLWLPRGRAWFRFEGSTAQMYSAGRWSVTLPEFMVEDRPESD